MRRCELVSGAARFGQVDLLVSGAAPFDLLCLGGFAPNREGGGQQACCAPFSGSRHVSWRHWACMIPPIPTPQPLRQGSLRGKSMFLTPELSMAGDRIVSYKQTCVHAQVKYESLSVCLSIHPQMCLRHPALSLRVSHSPRRSCVCLRHAASFFARTLQSRSILAWCVFGWPRCTFAAPSQRCRTHLPLEPRRSVSSVATFWLTQKIRKRCRA